MASFLTQFSSCAHAHKHVAMKRILTQDHWVGNTVGVHVHGHQTGRAGFVIYPSLTQCLNVNGCLGLLRKPVRKDFFAAVWQISNFSSIMHLLLKTWQNEWMNKILMSHHNYGNRPYLTHATVHKVGIQTHKSNKYKKGGMDRKWIVLWIFFFNLFILAAAGIRAEVTNHTDIVYWDTKGWLQKYNKWGLNRVGRGSEMLQWVQYQFHAWSDFKLSSCYFYTEIVEWGSTMKIFINNGADE